MIDTNGKSRILASMAIFRELYNHNKDIYGILSEFIINIIYEKGMRQFTSIEIKNFLNEIYEFNIPEAVVKTAIKRLGLKRENGVYLFEEIKEGKDIQTKLSEQYKTTKNNNEFVIENLIRYIEEEKKTALSDGDKIRLVNALCSYLLNETQANEYIQYISAFIIKNKEKYEFYEILNKIKEGVILYEGLRYFENINDIGSWITSMVIFLETEILFSIAGYNGELHKANSEEFYSYVSEINNGLKAKNSKNRITLKYFKETKDEIDGYFKKAENIVLGKETLNPSKTAMTTIVNGCRAASDVIEKKAAFYKLLEKKGIIEEDKKDFFSEENHKYNIEEAGILKTIEEKLSRNDIEGYLRLLNYINILRRGDSNKKFENIDYILLTGNRITLYLALHNEIRKNDQIPLATTLDFLINTFWFKLNKGFGKGNYPKSFDIISKAQVILSTQLCNSVATVYDELHKKIEDGEITQENAIATYKELRQHMKKPEDITVEEVDDTLAFINENNVEHFIKEHEYQKNISKENEKENKELKIRLKEKEEENLKQNEKLKRYERIEQRLKIILNWTRKIMIILFLVGVLCYLYYLTYKLYTEKNWIFTFISGAFAGIVTIVCGLLSFFRIDYKTIEKYFHKNK